MDIKLNESLNQVVVAVIHHGYRDYIPTVLEHCRLNGNLTCLIGSEEKLIPLCDEFYSDSKISLPNYEAFEKKYEHLSYNPESFELLCFKRFYLLQYLVHHKNLPYIWMIDSDVMVMNNLFDFTKNHLIKNNYAACLSTRTQEEYELDTSTHCSFWTRGALDDFVKFLDSLYDGDFTPHLYKKFDHHTQNNLSGGVCDMTALFLWKKNTPFKIFNSASAHLQGLPFIDHNVNLERNYSENEFKLCRKIGIKYIEHQSKNYQSGKVKKVAVRTKSGSVHPVLALHFQGRAKKYLPMFCETYQINYLSYFTYQYYKYYLKLKALLN
jgi:hypothetical protein